MSMSELLRTVYFSIFDLIMQYGLQVWGQKQSATLNDIERLQNKAARIMYFKSKYDTVNPAYKKLKILKLRVMLTLSNCQLVHDEFNGKLPVLVPLKYKRTRNQQNYSTRGNKEGKVIKLARKYTAYCLNPVNHKAASDWNESLKHINLESNDNFQSETKFTKELKEFLFSKY